MWQWMTNLPRWSAKWPASRIRSPGIDEEGVLEAVFPGRRRLAVAGEQVPVVVVEVHHVGDRGAVDELPDLGRAELREGVGAGRVEGRAVDQPGRLEQAADVISQRRSGLRSRRLASPLRPLRQRPQPPRHPGPVRHPLAADAELHQRPDVGAGAVAGCGRRGRGCAARPTRPRRRRSRRSPRPARPARAGSGCGGPASASVRCRCRSGPSARRWRGAGCRCGTGRR